MLLLTAPDGDQREWSESGAFEGNGLQVDVMLPKVSRRA